MATPAIAPAPDDDAPVSSSTSTSIEHALSHWVRLVSRFIDMGEPMGAAMDSAARIVAFARTGPLDGGSETRRSSAPESGVRRRRTR